MAKLTLEELENLSRLLLSEDDSSVELGLSILQNHQEATVMLCRELVLIWQLHDSFNTRTEVHKILKKKYALKQLESWKMGFEMFRLLPSIYTYTPKVQRLIKDHENVRSDYQNLMERNSKYCLKYYLVAKRLHQTLKKHLDIAESYYRIVLKTNPMHEDNLFYLAYLLDKSPEGHQEALEHYLTVESINPKSSATLNNIALIYDHLEQQQLSYDYYKKALQLQPSSALYLRNIASLCTNRMEGQKYKDEAKELLIKLIKIDPRTGNNWNSWADYLWNIEQNYEAAQEAYSNGLQVDPKNPWLLGNLGELYIDVYKQYDKGLDLYKEALAIEASPYRLVTMITVLVDNYQDYGQAKKWYKKLIELSPPNQITRNRYLRDDQWNAFLEAEKKLLNKIK